MGLEAGDRAGVIRNRDFFCPCCELDHVMTIYTAILLAAGLAAQTAEDQSRNKADREDAPAAEFLSSAEKAARQYEFHGENGETPLVLHAKPLLHWSNPVVGQVQGGAFLWTDEGRPQVIGAMFRWDAPSVRTVHEFQSLSTEPLIATRGDAEVWRTSEPGVTFRTLPDASKPASTPVQRLGQMRRLAAQFSAYKTFEGVQRDLRLLRQPLYRYRPDSETLLDGALFAFVEATDPDLLLLIEAHQTGSNSEWRYAFARLYHDNLSVRRDGAEIWDAELIRDRETFGHRATYTKFRFDSDPESTP